MTASLNLRPGILVYGLDRHLSGISRYGSELISELTRLGLYVTLLGGPATNLLAADTYPSVSLPGCRLLPGLMTLGNIMVWHAAAQNHLDIIHDPTGVAPFLFGAGKAKTVVTVHDMLALAFPGTSTLIENIITRFWLPVVLPNVDAIIVDSQCTKADILRFTRVPENKIHIVLIGQRGFAPVDPVSAQIVLRRFGLQPGYILTVSSFEPRRNLARLLEAYACLRQEGEERLLVMLGKPRLSKNPLFRLVEEFKLQSHVILPGYVSSDELPAFYSAADLFVFPSLYEGFGLPPLEAMACGTPVVVSNSSSLPEVIGDSGVLVDPYNVTALADGMRRVLADTALQDDLRARGLKRAAEFSWERSARQTLEVYKQVLS
jgi:glycosyltransferase involved in cell wall biosynthesis